MYLDYNATTMVDHRVVEAMLPWFETHFGNPSSVHQYGRRTRAAIETAREQVAGLLNAHPSQVIFTSGGTEANNLAIKGSLAAEPVAALAHSAVEHSSVMEVGTFLEAAGWHRQLIGVDANGTVNEDTLLAAIDDKTRLVSVMLANNENGVVQPVARLAETAKSRGIIMHTDAVQAAGKIPVDFKQLGVDLLSISGHKIYGPKGIGALVYAKSIDLSKQMHGGGHEKGLRAGTENLAGIVGLGAAAELAREELAHRQETLLALRTELEQQLQAISGLTIFGLEATRVANTVQFGIQGQDGATMLMQLDKKGIAISSGSACSSGKTEPSHVLLAMKVEPELARSAIRVSLGKDTTQDHINEFVRAIKSVIGNE